MKRQTSAMGNSMNRSSVWLLFLHIPFVFALACFALSSQTQAVIPPPDGSYPNLTTAEGQNALKDLTTGVANTALGAYSLFGTTTGSFNTAVGAGALDLNTGDNNTAVGVAALLLNTGIDNTAMGVNALGLNTAGANNAAVGASALYNNTIGNLNTAMGAAALFNNTTGGANTATGYLALQDNATGNANTASGYQALKFNTIGNGNTAMGYQALNGNATGLGNTAVGVAALQNSGTGNGNTAIGSGAGSSVSTASSVTCIGTGAAGMDVSNTSWIANVYFVPPISGTTTPVIISNSGQLGTAASSERFKKDIATMEKASEAILSLRPVTFHYKTDGENTPQFGLIAEEVAKVNPALVLPDKEGKPFTVRYDAVNAMLLNEFLKEHRKNEQQEVTIARQQKQIDALTAGLKEQAAQIQKVSAQLEASQSAPQTVLNNQ